MFKAYGRPTHSFVDQVVRVSAGGRKSQNESEAGRDLGNGRYKQPLGFASCA